MNTVFSTPRILFVQVSEELIPDYLVMVNDIENVERFLGGTHAPYNEQQEIAWVRDKLKNDSPVFSMLEKSSGRFIGNIEFMTVRDGKAELGIAITAEMQNKGFGTEAIKALLSYGVKRYALTKVVLRARPWNPRALRVYQKCGFTEYDRTENDVFMEIDLAGGVCEQ